MVKINKWLQKYILNVKEHIAAAAHPKTGEGAGKNKIQYNT